MFSDCLHPVPGLQPPDLAQYPRIFAPAKVDFKVREQLGVDCLRKDLHEDHHGRLLRKLWWARDAEVFEVIPVGEANKISISSALPLQILTSSHHLTFLQFLSVLPLYFHYRHAFLFCERVAHTRAPCGGMAQCHGDG